MKKLLNLVLGFTLLTTSLFSQEFLPERFKNYRETGKELFSEEIPVVSANNLLYKLKLYDVDQDSIEDVVEFYLITGYSRKGFKTLNNPRFYHFDFNGNGKLEEYEWLIDYKMDGLNGNEETLYTKPKKPKLIKI